MSQAQLAFPELSDSYISLIESDKRIPAPAVVELLARKLGCSATYLVSGVSEQTVNEIRTVLEYAKIAMENGEAGEARDRFADVIAAPATAALPDLLHQARWGHAMALESTGELEGAISELRTLVSESLPERDPDHWARLNIALTRCYRERGHLTESIRAGENGVRALTAAGVELSDARIELEVTILSSYVYRGDLVRAAQLSEQLIKRAERLGTPRARMAVYWQAAFVAQHSGKYEAGIPLAERALALLGEGDDERNISRLRGLIAMLLLRTGPGNAERARTLLLQVTDAMSANRSSDVDVALNYVELARAETTLGRPGDAVGFAEKALDMLGNGPRRVTGWSLTVLGEAYMRMGRRSEAVDTLTGAAKYLEEMESNREAAYTWSELGELLGELGDEERQCEAYRRALACIGVGGR
jgi:tetratricopeptide (TPR) repeat protein